MKKELRTTFDTRQYMLSEDFEIYYYNDRNLPTLRDHTHNYYEFYFFLEGDVSLRVEKKDYKLSYGDMLLIPPGVTHHVNIHSTDLPYRRFVLWISQDYCNKLIAESASYGYLMDYVHTSKNHLFHNDLITFNAIQFQIFQLIE